jgi:hypothetical protein
MSCNIAGNRDDGPTVHIILVFDNNSLIEGLWSVIKGNAGFQVKDKILNFTTKGTKKKLIARR